MPNPIVLGSITIYARLVVLDDGKEAFSVVRYTTPEFKCRVPFNQTPDIEGNVFVRPEDASARFPPAEGSDTDGECGVEAPFLKYYFKEGNVVWIVVNQKGEPNKALRGRLSEIFRVPIG
jgi:hypothetical protein